MIKLLRKAIFPSVFGVAVWVFVLMNAGIAFLFLANYAKSEFNEGFDLHKAARALGYIHTDEGAFCNIVLVGDNMGLTNVHCIQNQEACDNTTAYFSYNGSDVGEGYECKTYLGSGGAVAPTFHPHLDYALVEFYEEPGLDFASVRLAAVDEQLSLNDMPIIRLNFDPPTQGFRENPIIRYSKCEAKLDPHSLNWVIKPETDKYSCHVLRGNSGGAIFNQEGQLIGLTSQIKADESKSIPEFNDWFILKAWGPSVNNMLEQLKTQLGPYLDQERRSP